MFQHGDLVLRQKRLDRQGILCRCVVLVKNPWAVLPHFKSSSHPLTRVRQNLLVVDLVNGLTFRHPIHVNNPSDVGGRGDIIIASNLNCCAVLCFAFVNWGSSSAWIGAYFLSRTEKTMIHYKLLRSLKIWVVFSVLKNLIWFWPCIVVNMWK